MDDSRQEVIRGSNVNPKAWHVLRKVTIGTHQTVRSLMSILPNEQVRVTDQNVMDYDIEHEKREVKLVAPKVCQLGFNDGPISANCIIKRGLQHPNLSRSPVGAVVKLRQQYHDQPPGDTCVGSHKLIDSDPVCKRLHIKRWRSNRKVINAHPGNKIKYGTDHRFIFEVYKTLNQ